MHICFILRVKHSDVGTHALLSQQRILKVTRQSRRVAENRHGYGRTKLVVAVALDGGARAGVFRNCISILLTKTAGLGDQLLLVWVLGIVCSVELLEDAFHATAIVLDFHGLGGEITRAKRREGCHITSVV